MSILKNSKPEDKPYASNTMTEAQFLAFIRSALRAKWLRWKPRSDCIAKNSRPYIYKDGGNKRQKKEVFCHLCNKWFPVSKIEVDHFPEEAGSILSYNDIGSFCKRLFCELDNLRTVCKSCHKVHTYAEKNKISFEQAEKEKYKILMHKKSIEELKDLYTEHFGVLTKLKKVDIVTKLVEKLWQQKKV